MGALIGWAFVDLQCTGDCGGWTGFGALVGASVGHVVEQAFPGATAPPGAYALVGMGAVVAATTHAPITAILIIFELTNEYRVILPLMTSCIIATLLANRLHPESIYTLKLMRRGVNLRAGQDINLLRGVRVREVMRDKMTQFMIDIQALNLNNMRRRMPQLMQDKPLGLPLMNKLARTELIRELTEFSLSFQGTKAGYYVGDENAVDEGYWHRAYLNSFSATIGGGTSEIQRNIVAEHVLGLPKTR